MNVNFLNYSDILKLIDVCENAYERAVIEVLYGSGLKVTSLCKLKWSDVDFNNDLITITKSNGHTFQVPFNFYEGVAINLIDTDYLYIFGLSKNRYPHRTYIINLVKILGYKAGFKFPIVPQMIRQAFASHLLEAGADPEAVRMLMGHDCISTTSTYIKPTLDDLKETIHNYSLRSFF